MKYIDAERLKEILKSQIKERKEWMKDIYRSDRQDQLWSDLNGEDISILQIINSLQQEQQEADIDTEIHEKAVQLHTAPCYEELEKFARHFYELGLNTRKEE